MFSTPSAATTLTTSHQHHDLGYKPLPVDLHRFFLHILKSVLNTARLSETRTLLRFEVSVSLHCTGKASQVSDMASGLKPIVVQLALLVVQTERVHAPLGAFAFVGPSAWMFCLWSFTQFRPSLNSSFIKITYPVTAAYYRKDPHSSRPTHSSPSLFFSRGLTSHLLPRSMTRWKVSVVLEAMASCRLALYHHSPFIDIRLVP